MPPSTVTLRDTATQTRADILVGFGFNCYQFQTVLADQTVDVIWSEEGFEHGARRASGSGIPLLFPFPGRIQGTTLTWQGRDYPLSEGDGLGNAIHGFVLDRPWRVQESSESHVTGEFQAAVDAPELREHWPADFRLRVTYRLRGRRLQTEIQVNNPGQESLPFGLGTHPYFCLPLDPAGSADECRVLLPVSTHWELSNMNATGHRVVVPEAAQLQQGTRFGDLQLDRVFSGLRVHDGRCVARLDDPLSGRWVRLEFDAAFRECVVYTPPHRQAICIEPYTCVPDPFRLQPQGVDAGLRVLAPGESFNTEVAPEVGSGP